MEKETFEVKFHCKAGVLRPLEERQVQMWIHSDDLNSRVAVVCMDSRYDT